MSNYRIENGSIVFGVSPITYGTHKVSIRCDNKGHIIVNFEGIKQIVFNKKKIAKYINEKAEEYKTVFDMRPLLNMIYEELDIYHPFALGWYPNSRERQSGITRLLNLLRSVSSIDEQHTADDVTQDIPNAPKREEAESTEKAEAHKGQESEEGTGENSTSDAESVSEKSGGSQDGQEGETQSSEENGREAGGSDQGTAENEDGKQENTSQSGIDIETEIAACFGIGVDEDVTERHDTIAGIEQGRGLLVSELRGLFEKLAYERAPYGRTDELEHWDGRKLVLAKASPNKLMRAKSGKEKDTSIFFFLDDSGSMYEHARMFQELLEASRHIVHVYRGSEAHPVEAIDGSYSSDYIWSFHDQLKKWLDTVRPTPGSVMIFWGDTCDMNIRGDEQKVRKLLRPYRAYWLGTYKQYDYYGWEQECLPVAGFKVIAPVSNLLELRQAIKKIR